MSKRRPKAASRPSKPRPEADLSAEVERLRRELAEAQAKLQQIERDGADAYLKRRMAELDEARLVARGQALDAAGARNKAEAELRTLRDRIGQAGGLTGWLIRRAQRKSGF